MARTLVAFHAHPDDESLLTAGTMAKAAAEGHRVVLVVATRGEVGQVSSEFLGEDDLGERRTDELQRSTEILGVDRLEWLGYRDSGSDLSPDQPPPEGSFAAAGVEEAAARLAAILREEHADVLTIYDPNGGYGHPDHVQVHHVGRRAAELAGTPLVLEATISRELMQTGLELAASLGHEVPPDFAPSAPGGGADFSSWYTAGDEITHVVDVSAFLPQKRASMAAHASQATSASTGVGSTPSRSLAVFLSLPDEYFALAFGTEWFVERGRTPDPVATDVFATLDRVATR